jgi:IMP cyclohydrolase
MNFYSKVKKVLRSFMGTKFENGDEVYVEIRHKYNQLIYKGIAFVCPKEKSERNNVIYVRYNEKGIVQLKYVYTDGTDGDIIRHLTKLERHLKGVE